MKTLALSLSAGFFTVMTALPSFACSILPVGDSSLRVNALHETLGDMEQMTGFKALKNGLYKISVSNFDRDKDEVRIYRLENTSPMCPVYKATRVE